MNDKPDIRRLVSAASVSSSRRGIAISLLVLHSDPRPAQTALDTYTAPTAAIVPHYYIDATGLIFQLVVETRTARHSGISTWQGRRRNIDRLSIGITLEHTPGSPFNAVALNALHMLVADLRQRYSQETPLARWVRSDLDGAWGQGTLIPFTLRPVPVNELFVVPDLIFGSATNGGDSTEVTCVPPEPPPATAVGPLLGGIVDPDLFGNTPTDPQTLERFWTFLAQETCRQRGEGFQSTWAFHRYAFKHDLGAPLARTSDGSNQVAFGGKTYGFQVFARDTILNEIPRWTAVQSLNTMINGSIPANGLERQLLEASFATSPPLQSGWAFHQLVVKERLGTPLSGNYRISVGNQEYALQVFAGDTLYSPVPNWSEVRRLSSTPPGDLHHRLWEETYKPSGSPYQPESPFQRFASEAKLGAPLSGLYQADFEGTSYSVQVFALDTLYAGPDGVIARLSGLPKPEYITRFEPAQASRTLPGDTSTTTTPAGSQPDDALSNRRPTFMMLPISGQPRISQFYGYTKYSKQRTDIYSQTQARHSGLDFAVPEGTPLLAISHGVVLCAGQGCPFGANKPGSIVVRYGAVYAVYGHARSAQVRKGQLVQPGDVLGESGTFVGPHLHFELRPVPESMLSNRDPNQNPVNPGVALNPINFFTATLIPYFENQYSRLRGTVGEFCVGSLHDQPDTKFGGPLDSRPCTN